MLKKSRSKGYMLVEIILASTIAFAIAYLIINLTIKIKNKNDDLMTTTLTSTDQTIVSNKLSALLEEKGKDFDCEKLIINDKTISYDGNAIATLNDYANYNLPSDKNQWCFMDKDKTYVKINLPIEIKQQQDEYYDVNVYQETSIAKNKHMDCGDIIHGYSCSNETGGSIPYSFTYTGDCTFINDGNGNCRVKFTSDGNLTLNADMQVDVFLVGGGGGGGTGCYYYACGSGGGGGYTLTKKNITLSKDTNYTIKIGAGGAQNTDGESSTAFGFVAAGGLRGRSSGSKQAGAGGSAGGLAAQYSPYAGASDGGDDPGKSAKGQRSQPGPNGETGTTREFGEETGTLYAGGGGASGYYHPTTGAVVPGGIGGTGGGGTGGKAYAYSAQKGGDGTTNTGGGGGGAASKGGIGGSGIVVIRNAREQ